MPSKTFTLICPDPECEYEFTKELDPETDLGEDGPCIECPECGEEWEWELDEDGTLELVADDEELPSEDEDDFDEDDEDDE
jgi:hypothetical protein